MADDFENHCWKDIVPPDVLDIYTHYARKTFVGPAPALLAIDLYELAYQGGPKPVAQLHKTYASTCGENAYAAIEPTKRLFAAARADHVDKTIRPALAEGRWVLSDRFVDSSLAYQGGAGGLGIEAVRAINAFGIGEDFPDRTLVLLLEEGQDRAIARDRDALDRIGGRPREYHHKVETAFRLIAAEEPDRVRLIDASGSAEEVTERLLDALQGLLP